MAQTENIDEAQYRDTINDYVSQAEGLAALEIIGGHLGIKQNVDGKFIQLDFESVDGVIKRTDPQGADFLQINLSDGKKLLLTDKLIGFKPIACQGLDMSKLPKVVTTPDLISVFEAIEETLSDDDSALVEVEVLKKVFNSVIRGGEDIGFDLKNEKTWLGQITSLRNKFLA